MGNIKGKRTKKAATSSMLRAGILLLIMILFIKLLSQNSTIYFRDDPNLPFSLHLNDQDIYLLKGEEFKLRVIAINKRVSFSSNNFRVAGVNFNGRIRAHQTGIAFITAKVNDKDLICRVHVIDINKNNLNLSKGDTFRMKLKGSNAFVRWRSSNPSIASISLFGKIKAKKPGSTIITGRVKGKVLRCTVRVKK